MVDFSAFPVGCAAADAAPTPEQLATAAAIGDVCRLHGFLKLRNFGIAAADVDAMFARARELFALPADHKSTQLAHHDKNSLSNRGYFPVRQHSPARPGCALALRPLTRRHRGIHALAGPASRARLPRTSAAARRTPSGTTTPAPVPDAPQRRARAPRPRSPSRRR